MGIYMLIMRTVDEAAAQQAMADAGLDFDKMIETMGRFNEELFDAGVLVAMEGLEEAALGAVVDYSSTPPVVTDGPYGETKELFNGYWQIDVPTKEAAIEWALKVPAGPGVKTEIRRVPTIDEFPSDNPWIQREIEMRTEMLRSQLQKAEG
ncbi:YciI family protein [Gryllotalpicola protaetiae]|uniref:Transcription initiation protein n=1 Tax=Gryllotalpicola protaetiae TaxID=2419771 RepID=A0A387BLG5_9MICO|nr:YciI family protein [Gryllotalpicola protaetiae]AYG02924.1 transcription initiation protein [Gryllotalpicola protaetiae]